MTAHELDIRRLERRTRGSGLQLRDWPSSTRPGIRIVDLPTAQVRVRIAGHGPRTLVFACDMPNVVESYDVLFHLLQDDFRVVCFEQPGFGFSYPKRGFDFTRRAYAEALTALLRTLGLGPYVLAFPCVSVFYGLQVASDAPELIEALVLMQASHWSRQCDWAGMTVARFMLVTASLPFIGRWVTATPLLGQLVWASVERSFARRTHPHVIYKASERTERFQQIAAPLYDAFDQGACNCMASAYQRYFERDASIPVVSQPTLVLWATEDRSHRASDPRGLLRYAPHAEWRAIPDTGHHLELESPERIAGAIRSFVALQEPLAHDRVARV